MQIYKETSKQGNRQSSSYNRKKLMKVEGMLELQNHQLFWGRTKKLIKQE
jgi:hypothetical protein